MTDLRFRATDVPDVIAYPTPIDGEVYRVNLSTEARAAIAKIFNDRLERADVVAVSRAVIEQARFLRNQAMTHGWSSTASIQHAMMALVDQLLGERTKMTIPLPTIPNDPSADTPGELVEDVLEILEIMSPGSKMHTRDEVDSAIRVVLHQRSKKQKEPK